jgi:hypothetical protein
MTRIEEHREALRRLDAWEPYLLQHSALPGPRANLELLAAVVEEGDTPRFLSLLEHGPAAAPYGSKEEFLAACGAAGLGKSIAAGATDLWPRLRDLASDPRWRVREAVAMALQRIGDEDSGALLAGVGPWIDGGPLERRALAAGLCEPRLLHNDAVARAALDALDALTAGLEAASDTSTEGRVLRKALGYCWSVALVARPDEGMQRFERWARSRHTDVRWVVRQNLKKNRLRKLDPAWVETLQREVEA